MNNQYLDALFTGLTGAKTEDTTGKEPTVSQQSAEEKRERKAFKSAKQTEERFCTIVSSVLLRKIRIIANREGLQIKDVVNAAFEKAVKSYERKHGVIEGEVRRNVGNLF